MSHRDYTFLGTTNSLCPQCLTLVPAKILVRRNRVYFRKRCPTHGVREDFVCSDARFYDRMEYSVPAKMPQQHGVEPRRGCPFDCGLCSEHEQHTCVGLVELTSACNLSCPMCYASSGPGGEHLSYAACCRAIDRLVEVEGRPEVLQLSGGEPTIHSRFADIYRYAIGRPIDYVMINTNGLRFAQEPQLVELLAEHRDRTEVYFQLDGLSDTVSMTLRGARLLDLKLAALDALGRAGVQVTLVCTLQPGVNESEMGNLVMFASQRPWISGVSFQPATYSGRHVLPEQLERRITFPDVIRGVSEQTDGLFQEADFMPLPCAHPNCHSLAYAYRSGQTVTPLTRFIDARKHLDLLANGISFTRPEARQLMLNYLGKSGCCGGDCGGSGTVESGGQLDLKEWAQGRTGGPHTTGVAGEFFRKVLNEQLGSRDLFRVTVTSFLDAYNFDVRRVMKCCTHHVLPSGHVIPFCAYNVLYREGHVPLPELIPSQNLEPRV